MVAQAGSPFTNSSPAEFVPRWIPPGAGTDRAPTMHRMRHQSADGLRADRYL